MILATVSSPAPKGHDDAQLVAAMARGDSGALAELAARYGPIVFRLAYRMLDDAAEAEDVAQEVLVRLWDRAAGWVSMGGGVGGWLRRSATNLCIDRLRRRARLTDAPDAHYTDDSPDALASLDGERLRSVARLALAALPDRQRAAIVLTYYEELSNLAAAEVLEMTIKAFESLLFRARAALRQKLADFGVTAEDVGGMP